MEGPSGAVHRMLRFKMEISVCLVVTNSFHCHGSPVAPCLQEVVQIYKDTMMGFFFPFSISHVFWLHRGSCTTRGSYKG